MCTINLYQIDTQAHWLGPNLSHDRKLQIFCTWIKALGFFLNFSKEVKIKAKFNNGKVLWRRECTAGTENIHMVHPAGDHQSTSHIFCHGFYVLNGPVKGRNPRYFHSLFLTFFCIIKLLIDSKHSIAIMFKNLFWIHPDIRNLLSPLFLLKVHSIPECCCQKCAVTLSVVK